MAHFKIIAGPVELRQSLVEVIAEKRHAKQIGGRTLIMSPRNIDGGALCASVIRAHEADRRGAALGAASD
jgi:hypothetical protein